MIRSQQLLQRLYYIAKEGLEDVAQPRSALERAQKKIDGVKVDDHAVDALVDDPAYLKGVAQTTLDQLTKLMADYNNRRLVVFLDIDDVLCTQESHIAHGAAHYVEPTAIGLLRELTDRAGICFVISSVWRLGNGYSSMRRILQACGLGSNILFREDNIANGAKSIAWRTPESSSGCRGQHIKDWLDLYGDQIDDYAIIDNDSDMLESQMGHFVHVDGLTGFNRRNFEEVLHVFGLLGGNLRKPFQPRGVASHVK